MKTMSPITRMVDHNDEVALKGIATLFQETDLEFYKNRDLYSKCDYFSEWSSPATNRANHFWISHDTAGRTLGALQLKYKNVAENNKSARIDLRVHKAHRRNGIGINLLHHMSTFAASISRTNFTISSNVASNSSHFLELIGAQYRDLTIERFINLEVMDANPIVPKLDSAEECKISLYENDDASMVLKDLATAKRFLDDRPVGSRETERWSYSADWLSQERITKRRTVSCWWTLLLHHDGEIVGYCEADFCNGSEIAYLAEIAVHPEFRNKGLGKWLKMALIFAIKQRRKSVRFVRTMNSLDNTAVGKVAEALGFFENNRYSKWTLSAEVLINKIEQNEKISDFE